MAGAQTDEFHYGYGGIAIRTGGEPTDVQPINFDLDDYRFWGDVFTWDRDSHRVKLSLFSVGKASAQWLAPPEKEVIAKFKASLLREIDAKSPVEERPYSFQGSSGIEIRTALPKRAVRRMFFYKSFMVVLMVFVNGEEDLAPHLRVLDSLRLLTPLERTVAMIEEFAPPPLSQARPKEVSALDTTELGLVGAVRMVRDTTPPIGKVESQIVQEIQFSKEGFRTREIVFNQGYPDVITSWGWDDGKRVNIQSAVNYPPCEGPLGGRSTVVTGSLAVPGYGTFVNRGPKYGNRIDTELDPLGRPLTRRRLSNTGSLVLVEHYKYFQGGREVRTVDSDGGFMGAVRERVDANNNVVETQTLTNNGKAFETTRFEYELDPKGNWIVRKAFRKDPVGRAPVKPISIVNRTVRYYDEDDRSIG